jgi:cysteine desulfurase
LLHTDAVQAPGRIPLSFRELGCDLMTLSGHKFGGPRGTGALVLRRQDLVEPILFGGEQEFAIRAGTENVAGIVGFAAALVAAVREQRSAAELLRLRQTQLREEIGRAIPWARFATPREGSLPNTLCIAFPGIDGRALLAAFDLEGIAVSVGSACASGSIEPSPVLLALGFAPEEARAAIRVSFGPDLSAADASHFLSRLAPIAERLKSRSR